MLLESIKLSLSQLLGREYMDAVTAGAAALAGMDAGEAHKLASEEIEFLPQACVRRMDRLLDKVGTRIIPELIRSASGAPTDAFRKASHPGASPVGGFGYLRLGEDGRLYLIGKSEHYHTPLGHSFPGYRLVDRAEALGIPNATHNNTRGHITRLLERELIRTANGLSREALQPLERILASRQPHVLNRVINLETGTLACEAGIKMMLARFYQLDATSPTPKYADRTPVFFVMADREGGRKANYHGTSIFAQAMRDMWPGLYERMEAAGIMKVCPVAINDFEDFQAKFAQYNEPPFKAAGWIHEIILMNYGGVKLEGTFLHKAYELCHRNDTPVMCDEIQSCMWYPGMFLFREYGLDPDIVVIGKGFPGGQYPASRVIATAEMDRLSQFGALVTNGQEELASLTYLVTMRFAEANAAYIRQMGDYYESRLAELVRRYPAILDRTEGRGHLSTMFFGDAEQVTRFTRLLTDQCIDISAQTYKAKCPPAALTKPPIIATKPMMDFMLGKMEQALQTMGRDIR